LQKINNVKTCENNDTREVSPRGCDDKELMIIHENLGYRDSDIHKYDSLNDSANQSNLLINSNRKNDTKTIQNTKRRLEELYYKKNLKHELVNFNKKSQKKAKKENIDCSFDKINSHVKLNEKYDSSHRKESKI